MPSATPARSGRHAGRLDPPVRADHGAPPGRHHQRALHAAVLALRGTRPSRPYRQRAAGARGHAARARQYAEAGYIDYPSQERASNLDPAEIAGKSVIFQHYAWNDYHYCAGPSGCRSRPARPPPGCSAPITYRARTSRRSFTPTGAAGWCSPPARPMRPSIAGTRASAAGRVWAAAPTAAGQLYPCRRHGGPDGARSAGRRVGQQAAP